MEHGHSKTHIVEYGTFVGIWAALIVLTGLTVAVSGVQMHGLAVLTAVAIAVVKSTLVLAIFMHLRYESRLFTLFFLVAILTLGIFIGLTFFDTDFR